MIYTYTDNFDSVLNIDDLTWKKKLTKQIPDDVIFIFKVNHR